MTGQRFVFRFQRVGGWCEPIGRTSLTPPRASDRTAKFSLSRFGRISAVKERAFGHEWARLRQTEWYRGEKIFVSFLQWVIAKKRLLFYSAVKAFKRVINSFATCVLNRKVCLFAVEKS